MTHTAYSTTAQQIAAANARLLLESEPRPAFDLMDHQLHCLNPDASSGQRNYVAIFIPKGSEAVQIFDGRHWVNFPV